jgi:hypothetical protein
MALTKSKKHYVGLTWAVGETKGGFALQSAWQVQQRAEHRLLNKNAGVQQ